MRTSGLELRRIAGIGVAGLLFLAGCGGDDGGAEESDETTDTTAGEQAAGGECNLDDVSWVAIAREDVSEVVVYAEPGGTDPIKTLENPRKIDIEDPNVTSPVPFLLTGSEDPRDDDWHQVYLPVPPNDSTGYISADDVDIRCHAYRVQVDLEGHQLTVTEEGDTIGEYEVGLGRAGRETRPGQYFITELIASVDPGGPYGPYAYGISGFPEDQEVINEFGVDASIGIHGTNQPEAIGDRVSSGCIRLHNDNITEMVDEGLPLGTPVEVS